MKKHTKIYLEHHGYTGQEYIPCHICRSQAVDIHHIDAKGMGGNKDANEPDNLVALCRACHEKAHHGEISQEQVQ